MVWVVFVGEERGKGWFVKGVGFLLYLWTHCIIKIRDE